MVEKQKTRIETRFEVLQSEGKKAFVAFITAGDPDLETSEKILAGLADAGADIIELGMPFTDPMADGPAIQAASLRALEGGQTMLKTLAMVTRFRETNDTTPIVLMGYYNPIYHFGVDAFLIEANKAGVDGLIVVDLPAEEDEEFCIPAMKAGINFIRLATPTTDDKRLPAVLKNSSGFVYYVSINGITGSASADLNTVDHAVQRIKNHTDLPIVVGFGIRTPDQARTMAKVSDGAVVGSALVDCISEAKRQGKDCVSPVLTLTSELAEGVHKANKD